MTTTNAEMYRLGPLSSIPPGEGRNFRAGEREIAVFRTRSGDLFATQSDCPHRGAPLADGLVGGGRIVCPFHSYAFDLATGEAAVSGCPALKTYRVTLEGDGNIYIDICEDSQELRDMTCMA